MARRFITENEKTSIVKKYLAGWTQQDCADSFSLHRKSIYNVLKEKGVLPEKRVCTDEEVVMLDLLTYYKMTPRKLGKLLKETRGLRRAA